MTTHVASQLKLAADAAWADRWHFAWDANGDDVVTISDVSLWVQWLFFAPGDWVLLMVMRHVPELAVFFEILPTSLSGLFSSIISFVVWAAVWLIWEAFS